jgi:hypothetical protein
VEAVGLAALGAEVDPFSGVNLAYLSSYSFITSALAKRSSDPVISSPKYSYLSHGTKIIAAIYIGKERRSAIFV